MVQDMVGERWVTTLRLSAPVGRMVQLVASVTDRPVADVLRNAVENYLVGLHDDEQFVEALQVADRRHLGRLHELQGLWRDAR